MRAGLEGANLHPTLPTGAVNPRLGLSRFPEIGAYRLSSSLITAANASQHALIE